MPITSTKYIALKGGDIIQDRDQYSTDLGGWKDTPDFLIGSAIPESVTSGWRRPVHLIQASKKKWYQFWK
jgi:hypothetical protein